MSRLQAYITRLMVSAILLLGIEGCRGGLAMELDGGIFRMSVAYVGESEVGRVYAFSLDGGPAGTYDIRLTGAEEGGVYEGREVLSASLFYDREGQMRYLVVPANIYPESFLCTVTRGGADVSRPLPSCGTGEPDIFFIEESVALHVGKDFRLSPVFYPNIYEALSAGDLGWSVTGGSVSIESSSTGATVTGLTEGQSIVAVKLFTGAETSCVVAVKEDDSAEFSLNLACAEVFWGDSLSLSLVASRYPETSPYKAEISLNGKALPTGGEMYAEMDLDLSSSYIVGENVVAVRIWRGDVLVEELGGTFIVYDTPRPRFNCSEGKFRTDGIFLCVGEPVACIVTFEGFQPDSWTLDMAGCGCVSTQGDALRGERTGRGMAKLTVRKGTAVWDGEFPVYVYTVVRIRPVFLHNGFSADNVRGGFVVIGQPLEGLTARSVMSRNTYHVTWGNGSSLDYDGEEQEHGQCSLGGGVETVWSLAADLDELSRYLRAAGATMGNLRSMVVREQVLMQLDDSLVAVQASDYIDGNLNLTVRLLPELVGLDENVDDFLRR